MKLSGSLWIWRDKQAGDPDSTDLSYRPTPRQWWHWLILFAPSVALLLNWMVFQILPSIIEAAVYQVADLARWPAFVLGCFALGFWWRRRWMGDRFGHGIMAGLAVLALNIGVPLLLFGLALAALFLVGVLSGQFSGPID